MEIQLLDRIDTYWSMRAEEMGKSREADLGNTQRGFWTDVICRYLPKKNRVRALDLGTGTGFYAFLLADLGAQVTAIDYSREMVNQAVKTAARFSYENISFLKMDAQSLEFADEAFDFIISRNVTWTLPDPERAYGEMCRVLAPGGAILNFDANYANAFRKSDEEGTQEEQLRISSGESAHSVQDISSIRERNDIAASLYIADRVRPQWDVDVLLRHGMRSVLVDKDFEKTLWRHIRKEDSHSGGAKGDAPALCPDAPLFMICAQKDTDENEATNHEL